MQAVVSGLSVSGRGGDGMGMGSSFVGLFGWGGDMISPAAVLEGGRLGLCLHQQASYPSPSVCLPSFLSLPLSATPPY